MSIGDKYRVRDVSGENNDGVSPLKFLGRAFKDHPIKLFLIFFGDLVQAVCILLLPFAIRDLVDIVTLFDPTHSGTSIWSVVQDPFWDLIWINVVWVLAARLSGTSLAFLAPVFRLLPRKRMTSYLNRHSVNFFQDSHGGALGTKINSSTVSLGHSTWVLAFDIWPVLIQFITSCVLVFFANTQMGITITIWSIVYITLSAYFAIKRGYWSEKISHERAKITGAIVDVASNIQAVKSFANEEFEEKKLGHENEGEVYTIIRFNILREMGGWIHGIMSFAAIIGLLAMALELYQDGAFSVGDIAFVFSLILILLQQAARISYTISHFLELFGQMADGVKTVFKPVTLEDTPDAKPLRITKSHISFNDVCFEYPETQNEAIFENFNLNITQNQKIGLIGKSGAGKTTLVNLLLRFFDTDSGAIRIDGQNISDVTQSSLRKEISVIPQDTALFHRTLIENIRYGRLQASDEEVIAAAKRAHADDFIAKLPNGYETMVGERGVKLSGGQRQRIAIARAILKDAPILVLDEATSALDSESERAIQDSLKDLMVGKTVIAIAHRLSTINHLDRLIVMDGGKIVEDGTHKDLLTKKGLYAKLWDMQSGGFLGA